MTADHLDDIQAFEAAIALQRTPITTADQITDDLVHRLTAGIAEDVLRQLRGDARPNDDDLAARQEGLKGTLLRLVHSPRVSDVAAVINALDDAKRQYADQFVRRALPRLARRLKSIKKRADQALQQLIEYHRYADQMTSGFRGPGTLDQFMAGKTEQLYPEAEPALSYLDTLVALRRDARLNPPWPAQPPRWDNPPHQELLTNLRRTLKRLGVSDPDITDLFRDTGLLKLTRADRR